MILCRKIEFVKWCTFSIHIDDVCISHLNSEGTCCSAYENAAHSLVQDSSNAAAAAVVAAVEKKGTEMKKQGQKRRSTE